MKSVAVFFGGRSVEHDISIITGVLTLNSLDKEKFNPIPIYVDNNGEWFTGEDLFDLDFYSQMDKKKLSKVTLISGENKIYAIKKSKIKPLFSISIAINCMHGERGEDGSLSGYLNMCNIPLASPSTLPSSISIDKAFTKTALKGVGVKTLSYVEVGKTADLSSDVLAVEKKFCYPVIVKPNTSGSSVGIKKANDREQLENAILFAKRFSDKVIVEKFVENLIEINCAAYKNALGEIVVSECERPYAEKDLLSFEDKYVLGRREYPANIPQYYSEKIKQTTKKVYEKLNCSGVIRIDFFISEKEIIVNEINSVPGSLAYYLFSDTVKGFSAILTDLINVAEKDFILKSTEQTKISTSILNATGSKSSKRL